jgi:uncharacterized membrane protein
MRLTALTIHIISASLGLISGFIALYTKKGSAPHRRMGTLFVYTMVTMSAVGTLMSAVWNVDPRSNVPVGLLTGYLVITGALMVQSPAAPARRLDFALMLVPLVTALAFARHGADMLLPGRIHNAPAFPFFIFAAVALLATSGDIRMIRAGGHHLIRGSERIARHSWRMGTALLIGAISFLGRASVIPKPLRIFPLLVIPPLAVLVTTLYWLWRVRFRKNLRGLRIPVRAA